MLIFDFLGYHALAWRRYIKHGKGAKILTALVFIFLISGIAWSVFRYTEAGLILISRDPFLKNALPLFIYEVFLIVTGFLIFVSALVSGVFSLFGRGRDSFIMASPSFRALPWFVFINAAASSFWPFFIIALPLLCAVFSVYGPPLTGIALSLLSVLVLSSATVIFSLTLLFISALFLKKIKRLRLGYIALVAALIAALAGFLVFRAAFAGDVVKIFTGGREVLTAADTSSALSAFRFSPSHLSVLTLAAASYGDQNGTVTALFKLIGITFFAGLLYWFFARSHLYLWQDLEEGNFEAGTDSKPRSLKRAGLMRFSGQPVKAILEKEALISRRSLKGLLWAGFLFMLWLTQIGLNFFIARNMSHYKVLPGEIPHFIEAFQILATIYFISAFVLRFAFPSMSAERKTAWIIGSSPVEIKKIFSAKLVFYASVFMLLSLFTTAANSVILGISPAEAAVAIVFTLAAVFVVTCVGFSLGTIFPNFETDDPQILSTSLPGIGFTLISVAYGILGTQALYSLFSFNRYFEIIIFSALSVCLVVFFLFFSRRALRRFEFA